MTPKARRIAGAILLGVAGTAALVALSDWQVRRLAWKEGLIATLTEKLNAAPVPLPEHVDPKADEFTRVRMTGRFEGRPGTDGSPDAPFLASLEDHGVGYRIIQPFTLDDGRRVLVTRGWVPMAEKNEGVKAIRPTPAPTGELTITGALRFPEETDSQAYSKPDNVWVDRDLARMSKVFDTEPVLVVAETPTPGPDGHGPIPTPLNVHLRNAHLQYAITWGVLALCWAGMTASLVRREMRRA